MSSKVALVTGSSRGIGLGTAVALARQGFAVAVNGPTDDEELKAALETVLAEGGHATKAPLDVTRIDQFDGAIERVENELGPLTTLVNNAGVSVMNRGDMLDVSEASYDRCMAVNTKSQFFLTQAFARRVLARQRRDDEFYSVINVTSSNARAVALPRSEYSVSKAAAAMATQCWAVRLGNENIHVYDVQPGLIDTDMTKAVIAQYEQRAKDGLTLLPRVGTPEEMGKIIANLASGEMPYVTGQVISADGGLLVTRY